MTRSVSSTTDVLGRTVETSGEDEIALSPPFEIGLASNDNFQCAEQEAFERSVARELRGDVDF